MLQAERAHDEETFEKLADDLKLPNLNQWLTDTFGASQANNLSDRYDRTFMKFRSGLVDDFKWTEDAPVELSTEYDKNPHPSNAPAHATDPVPRTHVEIESFRFTLKVSDKGTREWTDSYVKVDGTLRYVGGGASPFWSTPYVHACSKTQPPKLKKQYDPKYPSGVIASKTHRVVTVLAEIGKDGRIHDPHVAQPGSPDFDAAALDAVRLWVYEPATCDGSPISVKTSIAIDFGTP
jgi:TonB family protein